MARERGRDGSRHAEGDGDEHLWDYEIPIAVTQIVRGTVFFQARRRLTDSECHVIQKSVVRDHDMMMCSTWQDPVEEGEMVSVDVGLPRLADKQAAERTGDK